MPNYTFEDYKKAIKAKYEKEKNGEYSNNLNSPTSANLRNLCVKRFDSNNDKDDLITFESFFEFPFDKDKKNLFGEEELNKLEAVKRFFLGKTERPAEDTIQLAAILVDLQPRPFNKFRIQNDPDEEELIEELRDTDFPKNDFFSDNLTDEVETEKVTDLKSEEQEQIQSQESEPIQSQKLESVPMPIVSVTSVVKEDKEKPENIIPTKLLHIGIVTFVVFGLVAAVIYFAFFNKQCMQWSEDHYEIVDCSSKIEGNFNEIIRLDKDLLDFRKIKACDTTTCFLTNGDPIVWYGKTANGIDFFNDNGNGLHPENKKALHPMTGYMFSKYLKGKICE